MTTYQTDSSVSAALLLMTWGCMKMGNLNVTTAGKSLTTAKHCATVYFTSHVKWQKMKNIIAEMKMKCLSLSLKAAQDADIKKPNKEHLKQGEYKLQHLLFSKSLYSIATRLDWWDHITVNCSLLFRRSQIWWLLMDWPLLSLLRRRNNQQL